MALAPISATVIDAMLAAGATCEQLAIIARRHFPELAQTVDALLAIGAEAALIGEMLKAHAGDRGAAAREAEKRKANTKAQQKCRAKARGKRAAIKQIAEPELPLSSLSCVSYDSDDKRDTRDPPSLKEKSPPAPPSKENNPSPISDPVGSAASSAAEAPRARLFREGKTILASFGVAEKRTGALIGMWLKQRDDPSGLLAVIQRARDQDVAEPTAWISATWKGDSHGKSHGRQSTIDTVIDLAEKLAARGH